MSADRLLPRINIPGPADVSPGEEQYTRDSTSPAEGPDSDLVARIVPLVMQVVHLLPQVSRRHTLHATAAARAATLIPAATLVGGCAHGDRVGATPRGRVVRDAASDIPPWGTALVQGYPCAVACCTSVPVW